MSDDPSPRRRAVVTGASSGIGEAFAERLARDGYDCLLVARRRDRLDTLAARLRDETGTSPEAFAADLADGDALRELERRVGGEPAPDILVNNAGFGAYMAFGDLDPDRVEELLRVQVIAVARLSRAVLPGMIARGSGTVVNVASRLAFSGAFEAPGLPKRATYSGAKAFVTTFTQLLEAELRGTGVRVQALCPGIVRTEFHRIMGVDYDRLPPAIVMGAADVVAASLDGLARGETLCIPALTAPGDIDALHASERALLEHSASGTVAERYRSR